MKKALIASIAFLIPMGALAQQPAAVAPPPPVPGALTITLAPDDLALILTPIQQQRDRIDRLLGLIQSQIAGQLAPAPAAPAPELKKE